MSELLKLSKRAWGDDRKWVEVKGLADGTWEVWVCGIGDSFPTEAAAMAWGLQLARLL